MKFSRSPVLSALVPGWRARLVVGVLLFSMAGLIGRAIYLQAFQRSFLEEKGEARYERVLEIAADRGRIFDRSGETLAMSTPVKSIWAIPDDAQLQPAQLRQMAQLLEVDVKDLSKKLSSDRNFVYLKRQVPPEVAGKIAALKLPGIHEEQSYRRFYPMGDLTAHMTGFTGVDDTGQEGVELAFNKTLTGLAGSRKVIKDRRGNVIEEVGSVRAPQNGMDIHLAMDGKLQFLAQSQLKAAVDAHKAKAGSLVMLDVDTGELLALANLPAYNPNNREKLVGAQLRNRAFTDTYEPGSTMKPFVAGMALESGKFKPTTLVPTGNGTLTIGNATIHDSHPNGTLTLAGVIQHSSNVGSSRIALTFPSEHMWNTYANLGFGKPLKLGFPGEVGGILRPWARWQPIEQATMSYGNGIAVTLIQMAQAYLVFARDGDIPPISLTKTNGANVPGRRVFSVETAQAVRVMLELVTQPGGTAPKAAVPGYRVGGKTGTAHKLADGRYVNKYVASFIGLAPASKPRIVVAVMIDEPSNGVYYGGEVAAPVFSNVVAGAMRALGVPQDAPLKQEAPAVASKEPVKEEM